MFKREGEQEGRVRKKGKEIKNQRIQGKTENKASINEEKKD